MPAAAKENSEEGAEAFARWYVETLNYLYQHPQTGVLDKYAGDNCALCEQHQDIIRSSVRNQELVDGETFSVLGTSTPVKGLFTDDGVEGAGASVPG